MLVHVFYDDDDHNRYFPHTSTRQWPLTCAQSCRLIRVCCETRSSRWLNECKHDVVYLVYSSTGTECIQIAQHQNDRV